MDQLSGAQFWLPMHPACVQYKTLISNTVDIIAILPRENEIYKSKTVPSLVDEGWVRSSP